MMNLHALCMTRGVHLDVHFLEDKSSLPKIIKSGERIFWMDYGSNLNQEILHRVLDPFEKGLQVLVFPAVKDEIRWEQFEKKTKAGSAEPANQRGLTFDTDVGKKLAPGTYECVKTSARVWAMDAKPVDRKLRDGKVPIKLPLDNNEEMFGTLLRIGIKIGVASEAIVVCHYTHECFGNIVEASGVRLEN
jgi:hypothetical protein